MDQEKNKAPVILAGSRGSTDVSVTNLCRTMWVSFLGKPYLVADFTTYLPACNGLIVLSWFLCQFVSSHGPVKGLWSGLSHLPIWGPRARLFPLSCMGEGASPKGTRGSDRWSWRRRIPILKGSVVVFNLQKNKPLWYLMIKKFLGIHFRVKTL